MQRTYPAIVSIEQNLYGISFPDFPGCVSSGGSPEEAMACGQAALTAHIALMAADGDVIPDPTPLAQVDPRPTDAEGNESQAGGGVFAFALLTVTVPGQLVRCSITLEESLVAEIDRVAGKGNRSAFLVQAALESLRALRSA